MIIEKLVAVLMEKEVGKELGEGGVRCRGAAPRGTPIYAGKFRAQAHANIHSHTYTNSCAHSHTHTLTSMRVHVYSDREGYRIMYEKYIPNQRVHLDI